MTRRKTVASRFLHIVEEGGTAILFSKFTGSIAVTSRQTADILRGGDPRALSDADFDDLSKQGFLVRPDFDEFSEARKIFEQRRISNPKLFVILEITQSCNLACPYCYQNVSRSKGSVSKENIDYLFAYVDATLGAKRRPYGNMNFDFMGGEPLLYKEVIANTALRMKDLAQKHGIAISTGLQTNAVHLSPDVARHVDRLFVAITVKEDHDRLRVKKNGAGTYDEIVGNLRKCTGIINDRMTRLTVRYNVNASNKQGVYKLFHDIRNMGIRNFDIDPHNTIHFDYNAGGKKLASSEFKAFYAEFLQFLFDNNHPIRVYPTPLFGPCKAYTPCNIKMAADGRLALCDAFTSPKGRIQDLAAGKAALPELFPDFAAFNPFDDPQCGHCADIGICGGKYFCKSVPTTGDLNCCDYIPYNLDDYLRFFAKNYEQKPHLFEITDRTL